MASCYCYVPLPLTILLQITVPRAPPHQLYAIEVELLESTLQQQTTSIVMPGSVEPKSKAATAAITRKKTDVTALLLL